MMAIQGCFYSPIRNSLFKNSSSIIRSERSEHKQNFLSMLELSCAFHDIDIEDVSRNFCDWTSLVLLGEKENRMKYKIIGGKETVVSLLGLWIKWANHRTMRCPNSTVCTTDFGVCTPSRLVEHGTQHDTTGSVSSTSVSTHRVFGTPHVGWLDLFYLYVFSKYVSHAPKGYETN